MRRRLVAALVLVGAAAACAPPQSAVGDLQEIQARGTLRVVVRPGFLSSPVHDRGRIDERLLLRQLAARLRVRLEWVEAPRHDQILEWLLAGRADLAVSRYDPAALLDLPVQATTAVDWVEDLVVAAPASSLRELKDAAGRAIHLHRSRSAGLVELGNGHIPEPWRIRFVPEEVPLEEVLRRVRAGRYRLSVVDSGLVEALPQGRAVRVLGPLAERRPLVWVVRAADHRLRAAVNDFLFAEKVLVRNVSTADCRDLPEIREAGVLRLVTRNSPTTCTVERGGLEGFEYDLALSFTRTLGVRLELSIPPPDVDPLEWLERGYGDLAALHEPLDPGRENRFAASVPYRHVDLVAVARARGQVPLAVHELAGASPVAAAPVASLCRLLPLEPAMTPVVESPGADSLSALLAVVRGDHEVAVVDSDTARLELSHRDELRRGCVVLPQVPLVWLANPSARELRAAVDRYLRRERRSGLVRQLVMSELTSWEPYVPPHLPPVPEGDLTPYDQLLQWVGRTHGLDWRLLASLMYEESRFDPDAIGPGGSAGLFQFLPFTWRELGVEDPHHPAEAAEAGARYLSQLMANFADAPMADRVAMAIAAYNVGPRHVVDARRLAEEMGFDPKRWAGSVETAMLILDDPEVARRFPAGVCRCRRAVGYTRRILRRYRAYTEQFPPL
jgi:membrane-bound lytic murein transglycosylase F